MRSRDTAKKKKTTQGKFYPCCLWRFQSTLSLEIPKHQSRCVTQANSLVSAANEKLHFPIEWSCVRLESMLWLRKWSKKNRRLLHPCTWRTMLQHATWKYSFNTKSSLSKHNTQNITNYSTCGLVH